MEEAAGRTDLSTNTELEEEAAAANHLHADIIADDLNPTLLMRQVDEGGQSGDDVLSDKLDIPEDLLQNNTDQKIDADSIETQPENRADPAVEAEPSIRNSSSGHADTNHDTELAAKVSTLMKILPDADPEYLHRQVLATNTSEEAFCAFVANAVDDKTKNYPKREDYDKRKAQENAIKTFSSSLTLEEFFEHFPNPREHFESKTDGSEDPVYQELCLKFLEENFPKFDPFILDYVFKKTHNLTKTVAALEEMQSGKSSYEDKKPEGQHLHFLQELTYINKKASVEDHFKSIEEARKLAFEQAKARNELLECPVCCERECLFEDMTSCAEAHLFCKNCVKKFAETVIGEGKNKIRCLDVDCKSEFPLQVLQSVLEAAVFVCLSRRLQTEEIEAAMIPGLETCPFCPYSYIPDENSLEFECQREDCRKVSCRKCKDLSHLPLKCEEYENDEELKARRFVEEQMTQALIRECPKCKKEFVKIDGCNLVTCSCGTSICYMCRQVIRDHLHFRGRCPQNSSEYELHVQNVIVEGAKAKQEVEEKGVTLKHDPTKVAPG